MDAISFDDKLAVLGLLAGAYIVFTTFGMVIGQPWSTAVSPLAALVQVVGILATAAIGVFLILVAQDKDIGELVEQARQ